MNPVIAGKTPEELRQNIQYLLDRVAILDGIALHARGHDRHDVDLFLKSKVITKGMRDTRDISYQRPLSLDEIPSFGEK